MSQPLPQFPQNWAPTGDFNPMDHNAPFKGRDYLNVQWRLVWFIRDQRAMIASGLAKCTYIIQTDLVTEKDNFAQFKTFIRDVLGNEATMYGSETAKDFNDYLEKASTKSMGRALLLLGYGTAFANDIDEGERPADAPQSANRIKSATSESKNTQTVTKNTTPEPQYATYASKPVMSNEEIASAIDAKAQEIGLTREEVKQFMKIKQISATRKGYLEVLAALENPIHACYVWAAGHLVAPSTLTHFVETQKITFPQLYEKLHKEASRQAILDLIVTPKQQEIVQHDETYIAEGAL